MKILILSTSHPFISAGIAALETYKAFKSIKSNEVKVIVRAWDKYPDNNIIIPIDSFYDHTKRRVLRKLKKILISLKIIKEKRTLTNPDYYVQDFDQTNTHYATKKILKKAGFKPDAIVVLFMPFFLSFKNLYELNKETKVPILLYMMDMAPMTGGCHYAWDCKGYTEKCGNCPAYYSNNEYDQSRKNWDFKHEYIEKTNIIPIAGTEWQYRQLQQSSLYQNKSKYKILLPIDEELFKPGNKMEARAHFNIPKNKKIIFFGAVSLSDKRKGVAQLMDALNLLKTKLDENKTKNIHLAIAGEMNLDLETQVPFDYTSLGYLSHQELARAFQSADIFVCPSIEDAGPIMINQSIMSGTPVVAFKMGVALDLVIDDVTGYIVDNGNSEDLAKAIHKIVRWNERKSLFVSENCRKLGLSIYSYSEVSKLFENLCYEIKNEES